MSLKNKTIIITGASRGIGRALAIRCASDGANIVIASKTAEPHPKLPGTIYSVAEEVERAGGKALPVMVDVRSEEAVAGMVHETVKRFGVIDMLVNNAGAIQLTSLEATPIKRYDLMQSVNARAVFLCSQACLPHLKKSEQPHIVNLSPPIRLEPKWFAAHLAYTISKYGMSMSTIGMAEEFRSLGISVNSVWPKTLIDTAAVDMLLEGKGKKNSRTPQIMADAIYFLLNQPKGRFTGNCFIDEDLLKRNGVTDFSPYACVPGERLLPDLYID